MEEISIVEENVNKIGLKVNEAANCTRCKEGNKKLLTSHNLLLVLISDVATGGWGLHPPLSLK